MMYSLHQDTIDPLTAFLLVRQSTNYKYDASNCPWISLYSDL